MEPVSLLGLATAFLGLLYGIHWNAQRKMRDDALELERKLAEATERIKGLEQRERDLVNERLVMLERMWQKSTDAPR